MKLLYFNNGSGLGTAKSGGTTRLIEVARRLKNKNCDITIVTTQGCLTLFSKEKFESNFIKVNASLFSKKEKSNLDRMWGYIISTIHSAILIRSLPKVDIVYAPSDFFCDVIPAILYKIYYKNVQMISMIHHFSNPPIKRKGNYLLNLVSYIGQQISFFLIRRLADHILVYDTPEGENICKLIMSPRNKQVSFVANGIDYSLIENTQAHKEKFDACFAGGLRTTKGIYDVIKIWQKVCDNIPSAILGIAGEGNAEVSKKIRTLIDKNNLKNNILLLGALSSNDLYAYMKSSTLFLSTSQEEGWGIAICEAMASNSVVIAYSLPAFKYLKGYIKEVTLNDHVQFSNLVINYLSNKEKLLNIGNTSRNYIRRYDWDNIAERELEIFYAINK